MVVVTQHLHVPDNENLTILACIASLYILKTLPIEQFMDDLNQLTQVKSPIIQETLEWITLGKNDE